MLKSMHLSKRMVKTKQMKESVMRKTAIEKRMVFNRNSE